METTQTVELTESELDFLIRSSDSFCCDLERLEHVYANPRTVTEARYPDPYRLLSKLLDARVAIRTK